MRFRMFGANGSTDFGLKRSFHKCCENTRTYGKSSGMVELLDWNAATTTIPLLASDPSHGDGKRVLEEFTILMPVGSA